MLQLNVQTKIQSTTATGPVTLNKGKGVDYVFHLYHMQVNIH
jgi:hypothetical protein